MDCGPAALSAIAAGLGVPVDYGRLREACQTSVDGTSLDTLEDVANQLGLVAEQGMVPVDHLLRAEVDYLPALVVVRLPSGLTHLTVAWSRHGPLLQEMDPGSGRTWVSTRAFEQKLYTHINALSAEEWREWAADEPFLAPLRGRMSELGVPPQKQEILVQAALSNPDWQGLGGLDAAVRATTTLLRSGLGRGAEATAVLERLVADPTTIPPSMWSVTRSREPGMVWFHAAVLLRITGVKDVDPDTLPPALRAAVAAPPMRPLQTLRGLLGPDLSLVVAAPMIGVILVATMIEALVLRGGLEIGAYLFGLDQRLIALAAGVGLITLVIALELLLNRVLLRAGRHLEIRLRRAFLYRIPRLGDRYLSSRPISDLAERSHMIHSIRALPDLAGRGLRLGAELLLIGLGLCWLDPALSPIVLLMMGAAVGLPLVVQPVIAEADMRFRTHGGGLFRFYLDALLGIVSIRTHGAERAVRREQEDLLVEWAQSGYALQRVVTTLTGLTVLGGYLLTMVLLGLHLRQGVSSDLLLYAWWALRVPVIGDALAALLAQYPSIRNRTLRLLEPLGAPEIGGEHATLPGTAGVEITLTGVSVVAGGHRILSDLNLSLPAGSHVAVVGPSGAGKSSLTGLLLGWHQAETGAIHIDGAPLDSARLAGLRRATAWVDPAVQLWNRSFLDNLCYGQPTDTAPPIGAALDASTVQEVLERLPDGLQTSLGEGGGLVSGGEGQRVRLARAMMRPDARLVILDEAFRGLDRARRALLQGRARQWWSEATLICVTHDVSSTLDFPRVLVIEDGQIIEDGPPAQLAAADTRFAALLAAEAALTDSRWGDDWRRVTLADGQLREER